MVDSCSLFFRWFAESFGAVRYVNSTAYKKKALKYTLIVSIDFSIFVKKSMTEKVFPCTVRTKFKLSTKITRSPYTNTYARICAKQSKCVRIATHTCYSADVVSRTTD